MFGAKIICNPEPDVPDLAGKVAIVTGGLFPFVCYLTFSELSV